MSIRPIGVGVRASMAASNSTQRDLSFFFLCILPRCRPCEEVSLKAELESPWSFLGCHKELVSWSHAFCHLLHE